MLAGGTDLRDLYRPGGGKSRLTLRRLLVLIRGLPPDSLTMLLLDQDSKQAEKDSKIAKLKERTAYYEAQRAG